MNGIFHDFKQVFWRSVDAGYDLLSDTELTPARYAMLYAIAKERAGMPQRFLRGVLGLSRASISRMLGVLEDLGLLTRSFAPGSKKHRLVRLTMAGELRLQNALAQLTDCGLVHYATKEILNSVPGDNELAARAIETTHTLLMRARCRLGDISTLTFHYDRDVIPAVEFPREITSTSQHPHDLLEHIGRRDVPRAFWRQRFVESPAWRSPAPTAAPPTSSA